MISIETRDWGTALLASLALAVTIVASSLLSASDAKASQLGLAAHAVIEAGDANVTLVRDGCGRGMRFSNRLQACVEDGPRYVAPGCPAGTRFSERRQACVAIGQPDPGAAIVNGIINGVIQSTAPRGCPPGYRWSNGRGACVPR